MPEGVSDVEHIGLSKMNGDVAVGVGGGAVLEGNRRPVELHSLLICFSRGAGWYGFRRANASSLCHYVAVVNLTSDSDDCTGAGSLVAPGETIWVIGPSL
jgi:hypothetical protein